MLAELAYGGSTRIASEVDAAPSDRPMNSLVAEERESLPSMHRLPGFARDQVHGTRSSSSRFSALDCAFSYYFGPIGEWEVRF